MDNAVSTSLAAIRSATFLSDAMMSPLVKFPESTVAAGIAYCGSVEYYARLAAFGKIVFDISRPFNRHDHEPRRCEIVAPSGRQTLSVPTHKPAGGKKASVADLEVDFILDWRRVHWGSIFSAYGRSPFFEYYADRFRDVYERHFDRLVDYDLALDALIRLILGIKTEVGVVADRAELPTNYIPDVTVKPVEYYQVWAQRHGFQAGLSALDLVFNMGPESPLILAKMLELG